MASAVLVPSSMGERAGIGVRLVTGGEGSLVALVAVGPRTHRFASCRSSLELGTSRVVGKQDERGETKISAGQTKLQTRWKRVER